MTYFYVISFYFHLNVHVSVTRQPWITVSFVFVHLIHFISSGRDNVTLAFTRKCFVEDINACKVARTVTKVRVASQNWLFFDFSGIYEAGSELNIT